MQCVLTANTPKMTHMNSQQPKRTINPFLLKLAGFISMILTISNSYGQHTNPSRANIGLIYPLSSNWTHAPLDTNNFSLNLLAGVSAAERGISIAGVSNIVRQDAQGLQLAGFSNHIGKNANGTLIAGFMNTYPAGKAVAVAGFANISSNGNGAQISGFLNKGGNVTSVQVAGFANIARDVKGVQVAGFLNVAKKVKGTQLGFINLADSAGTQIGIINIAKNGEKAIGVTIDENQTILLSFRSGGKTLYGIIGTGYNFNNKRDKYAFEAGLGAHLVQIKSFRLNAELVSAGLLSFKGGEYSKSSFRLMPSLKLAPHIEIFGGPSINYINTDTEEGRNMTKKYISNWSRNNGRDVYGFYFGYTAGVQFSIL